MNGKGVCSWIEDPKFVAHLPDEACGRFAVRGFYLDAEEFSGTDGLDLLETRLVNQVPKNRLSFRIRRSILVGDYNADREKAFAGRDL